MSGPPAPSHGRPAPYVGLRPFGVEDNDRFFGRVKESHEVAALWRANKLTVLYGPSGVGKTSLLQAGVIPLLDPERTDLLPIGRVTGALGSVGHSPGNAYTSALLSSWAPDRSPDELADLPIKIFLRQRPKSSDRYGDPKPILLAIDHAEELFGELVYHPEHVSKFIAGLTQALRSHRETRLLLMVREDRLPSVLGYERILAGRSHVRFRLRPFGAQAALEAISKPLEGTGRRFQRGVAKQLVRNLQTVTVMNVAGERVLLTVDVVDPIQIQVVCSGLWESLPPSAQVITSAHVRRHANIDQFLANYVSRVLSAVAAEHGVEVARIRSWLQRTFITELGTRGTAYEGLDQTAGMPNAAVRSLEDRHLIKAEHRAGIRWYELQHDRLIEPLQQAHPVELLETAELELTDGRFTLAKRHADQAARACGQEDLRVLAGAERILGRVAQKNCQADEALRRYHVAAGLFEALQDSASVAETLAEAGRLSIERGRYAEAVTDLRAAAGRAPANPAIQFTLAQAFWYTGQPVAARAELNSMLEVAGSTMTDTMAGALRLRGEILADMNLADQALKDLRRVREGMFPSTLSARALAHAVVGKTDAAAEEAADATANAPDSALVLFRVARVHWMLGEYLAAAELVATALSTADPPLPSHLRGEAERLLDSLEDSEASHHTSA